MEPVIKVDLNTLQTAKRRLIIELGCGKNKKKGRIGIDRLDLPGVDIVADLEDGLTFLPDCSVDEIHSRSFFEHVQNFEELVAEVVRVLKKNGKCFVFVPHFSNPYYYSDYTHNKFMGLYTFYYFVESKYQLQRKVPSFYTDTQ